MNQIPICFCRMMPWHQEDAGDQCDRGMQSCPKLRCSSGRGGGGGQQSNTGTAGAVMGGCVLHCLVLLYLIRWGLRGPFSRSHHCRIRKQWHTPLAEPLRGCSTAGICYERSVGLFMSVRECPHTRTHNTTVCAGDDNTSMTHKGQESTCRFHTILLRGRKKVKASPSLSLLVLFQWGGFLRVFPADHWRSDPHSDSHPSR